MKTGVFVTLLAIAAVSITAISITAEEPASAVQPANAARAANAETVASQPSPQATTESEPLARPDAQAPAETLRKNNTIDGGPATAGRKPAVSEPSENTEKPKPGLAPLDPEETRIVTPKPRDRDASSQPTLPKEDNPVEAIVGKMRAATQQLQNQQTGDETRKLQEDVVNDLQKLIDLAEQAQQQQNRNRQNSANQQASRSDSPSSQDRKSQQQQAGNESQQNAGAQPKNKDEEQSSVAQGDGRGGQSPADAARNSSPDVREGQAAANAAAARREALHQDVWGHLPPAVRQKLMSLGGEKVLPKYDDLARRYFEALAEQSRRERE